ncbi:hypothetical protein LOY44_15670 [Pseudomonas sp. B21-044]|uniref:hypothetical protein n=1 Tax=Pseudomonas sp. B21-044 TaxID=2895488 RepID=UPI00215ED44A|nr:hypothetical protein [Pseudomonas sp. B21-044]UVL17458.1 hypothetical protein LOY44_15670 [Pseudomonas sp. B21-044]
MDRVIFGGCILLLMVGGMVGIGVGSTSSLSTGIRAALELLSFTGTAITAVVALVALTSWQTQFRHSEKWKALKAFQDSLDGGVSAHSYLTYLYTLVSQNQMAILANQQLNINDEFFIRQKAWMEYCIKVDRAWGQVDVLYDGGESNPVESHKDVEECVHKVYVVFMDVLAKGNTVNLIGLLDVLNECTANVSEKSRRLFVQSDVLLRKLVS